MALCIWPCGFAGSGVDLRFPGPAASSGEGAAWETAQLSLLSHEGSSGNHSIPTIQREQGGCSARPPLLRLSIAPNICEHLQISFNTKSFSTSAVKELVQTRADHLLPCHFLLKWESGIQLHQSPLCLHCASSQVGSLPGAWESPKGGEIYNKNMKIGRNRVWSSTRRTGRTKG